jgi:hypothetical protein
MSDWHQDNCGTIFRPTGGGPLTGPTTVTINNNGVTRPGWFNGTNVQG